MISIIKIFKKKRVVPHIRLSGIIGSVGRFKQGISFAGQQEVIDKAFSVKKALHYHAIYVRPFWSRTYKRLTQIGKHIFYSRERIN